MPAHEALHPEAIFLEGMYRWAVFSEQGDRRYELGRVWDPRGRIVLSVGLNPSTAGLKDDATTRKLTSMLRARRFGGYIMANLYPVIETQSGYLPGRLASWSPRDDADWVSLLGRTDRTLAMWGGSKATRMKHDGVLRTAVVLDALTVHREVYAFGENENGSPPHPLYLAGSTRAVLYAASKEQEALRVFPPYEMEAT